MHVHVHDERTLLVPDRRGNNRLDTLRNLLHDPTGAPGGPPRRPPPGRPVRPAPGRRGHFFLQVSVKASQPTVRIAMAKMTYEAVSMVSLSGRLRCPMASRW